MKELKDGFWGILLISALLCSCVVFDFYHNPKNLTHKVIGVSCMTLNNPFYEVINNELEKIAGARGDSLWILDPVLDAQRQEDQLEKMIDEGVDGIILNPVDSSKLQNTLKRAKEQRIPVVVFDSAMTSEEYIDATIVSKNKEAGKLIAKEMMNDIDQAEILLLEHRAADSSNERINGFLEAISAYPQYHIADREECKGQLELAMPATIEAFTKNPQINVIMALNDPSALGACAAAEYLGIEDLLIYGVDGTPDFKSRLAEDNMLQATAAQSPYTIAAQSIESLYKLLDGQSVEPVQLIDVWVINRENLSENSQGSWQ